MQACTGLGDHIIVGQFISHIVHIKNPMFRQQLNVAFQCFTATRSTSMYPFAFKCYLNNYFLKIKGHLFGGWLPNKPSKTNAVFWTHFQAGNTTREFMERYFSCNLSGLSMMLIGIEGIILT